MSVYQPIAEAELPPDESARTRVADAALKLFAAKGYAETTVREIIEAAGVTRPVLYYYFQNKAELFCYLIETEFTFLYQGMDTIVARHSACRDRLKALVGFVFERAEGSPEIVRFLLRFFFAPPDEPIRIDSDKLAQERLYRIVAIMADGVRSGEIGGGDPGALALAFSGMMDLHVMAKARNPEIALSTELGSALVDLFMDGAAHNGAGRSQLKYALEGKYPAVPQGAAGAGRRERES